MVVDAPLLLEAGIDSECDHLVFIDAPPEARLERVAATRGWTHDHLLRREAAQLPLDEKRSRADFVISNDGSPNDIDDRVRSILETIASGRG